MFEIRFEMKITPKLDTQLTYLEYAVMNLLT